MIKECKVLSYNKFLHILVFDYDGKQIQTTAILDTECKTVFVKKYEDGKYEIVSKNEYEKSIRNSKKKKDKDETKESPRTEDSENVSE
jgi:hypothetical protein